MIADTRDEGRTAAGNAWRGVAWRLCGMALVVLMCVIASPLRGGAGLGQVGLGIPTPLFLAMVAAVVYLAALAVAPRGRWRV